MRKVMMFVSGIFGLTVGILARKNGFSLVETSLFSLPLGITIGVIFGLMERK